MCFFLFCAILWRFEGLCLFSKVYNYGDGFKMNKFELFSSYWSDNRATESLFGQKLESASPEIFETFGRYKTHYQKLRRCRVL